jgi:hypothetical protein
MSTATLSEATGHGGPFGRSLPPVSVLDLVERIARTELTELLGDVQPPPAEAPERERSSEAELAARLAAEHHGECWATFAAGVVDEGYAGRALDLYGFTAPWLSGGAPNAAEGAAELLRHIGDGYALLSHPVAVDPLPLPIKTFSDVVVRALGIDAWAAGLGHPLQIDVAEAEYQLEHREEPESADRDPGADLEAALDTAARRFELLEVLADSPTGRTALQSDGFRGFAVERLAEARAWSYWVRDPEEGEAVQRLVLLAEAWFAAAHGGVASSLELLPGDS